MSNLKDQQWYEADEWYRTVEWFPLDGTTPAQSPAHKSQGCSWLCVQLGLENLYRWRWHSLSEQPVPLLDCPHSKHFCPYVQLTLISVYAYCLSTLPQQKSDSLSMITTLQTQGACVMSTWSHPFFRLNKPRSLSPHFHCKCSSCWSSW